MTPQDFIDRWQNNQRSERSAAQSFFNDLCELVDVPRPNDDPRMQFVYAFEEPIRRPNGTKGFADVSCFGRFAAEFKRPRESLDDALTQLQGYTGNLGSPPVLLVSDRLRIRIHTQFNGEVSRHWEFSLAELVDHNNLAILQAALRDPWSLQSRSSDQMFKGDSNIMYVAPAPVPTFDILTDIPKARLFLGRVAIALEGLVIGKPGPRCGIPSASKRGYDAILNYSSFQYQGIPDAEKSMHHVIKALQKDVVTKLITLASHVQRFQFEEYSQRYWLVGAEFSKAHAEMWEMVCGLRSLLHRMVEQLRAIGG